MSTIANRCLPRGNLAAANRAKGDEAASIEFRVNPADVEIARLGCSATGGR